MVVDHHLAECFPRLTDGQNSLEDTFSAQGVHEIWTVRGEAIRLQIQPGAGPWRQWCAALSSLVTRLPLAATTLDRQQGWGFPVAATFWVNASCVIPPLTIPNVKNPSIFILS